MHSCIILFRSKKHLFLCYSVFSKNLKNIFPRLPNHVDTQNCAYFTMLIAYMKQSFKTFINMLLGLFGWQGKCDVPGCVLFSPGLVGSRTHFRSPMSVLFCIVKWRLFLMTFCSRPYRQCLKPLLCVDQLASKIMAAAKTIVTFSFQNCLFTLPPLFAFHTDILPFIRVFSCLLSSSPSTVRPLPCPGKAANALRLWILH